MDSFDALVGDLIGLGFPQDFRQGKDWGYGVDLRQERDLGSTMYLTPEAVERLLSGGNLVHKSSAHNWRPNMYYFPDRVWFVTLDTPSHWKAPVYAWVTPVETVSDSLYRVSGQIPNLGRGFGTENDRHFGSMPDKMISEVHNDIEEWLSSIRG